MKGKTSPASEAVVSQEWQRVVDGCPTAACLVRLSDGAILAWNERCRIIAGCPPDAPNETGNILDLWTAEHSAEAIRKSLPASRAQLGLRAQFRICPEHPPREVRANLLLAPHLNGDCALAFLQQADEVRDVEQALATARDAAVESARLKSEFIANISHEIRTPLNGIIGMTQLLRDTKLGSLQRNFTETIRLSADNLLHLINEILDFSKLEAGKLSIEHAPFDLTSAVESTLDLLAERAHSKGLELTYLIHANVPARLLGDVGRLRQVLTNLINNAIKFTDQGEVALEVTAEAGDDGSPALKFEVIDTGIGIPETSLPHLFQKFQQVDSSTSRRFGGTGLGLAICRQLVEVMRGTIGVASKPGAGSCFWFRLPCVAQNPTAPPPAGDLPVRLQRLRVLLLEANATNARNLTAALTSLRIDCVGASSGQEALAALRTAARAERPFGIAILDMDTPGMDGLSLARAIKVEPAIASTRILLLTTLTQHLETSQLHASHIGACLTKPLKLSRLTDYLIAALTDNPQPRPASLRDPTQAELIDELNLLPSATPLRILIAEDNPINQKVARGLLNRLGHASEVVDNGRKLLRAVELAPYDIIFMDCQLPEMDGLQATRELRRRESANPQARRSYIIAMTADAAPGARARCIEAGMDDYLSKPIRLDELHSVLRRTAEFINLNAKRGGQPAPAGMIDPQVMETLRLLRQPGQPDPLPALFDEFIDTAQNRLEKIQSATMDHDAPALEYAAHSLRGSASGVGARRLSARAAELEDSVKHGFLNRAAEMLSQLEEEFLSVRRSLEFERER